MPLALRRILRATGAAILLFATSVAIVTAQTPAFARAPDEPVALVANEILYDANTSVVTARGAVQVFFGDRTLTADEIVYDRDADRLSAAGAITLRTGRGETVYADIADLDAALRDGIVRGAQSVIADGGAKLAAVEARRVDNRYNVLAKAVYSPCEVCAERPVPLWRIRARRIIHDQDKGEIHYDDAYFDLMGVTVGYLPYFRHPSPEVERATGFLEPSFDIDHAYGAAVKLPYFIVLDDYSDVTLTPFLAAKDGALLGLEYRRNFERGHVWLDLTGGVTNYDGDGAQARLGGFGAGRYSPRDGLHVGFDLAFTADDPFLDRYNFSDADRLTSQAFARAYDGRSFAGASVAFMQSLREGERQATLPVAVPEISARHVVDTPFLGGGELGFSLDAVGLTRDEGRDVGRISLGADWSRQMILSSGLVLRGFADARLDYYEIGDDPAFDGDAARFAPRAGVEARMPFVRWDDDGAMNVIEPIAQFVIAPDDIADGDIPNEDSVLVEFDETNLFEPDRLPGFDRYESGGRFTIGGRFERVAPGGVSLRASGGRIFRLDEIDDAAPGAGLGGHDSDYVAGLDVSLQDWAALRTSWRLSDDLGIERAEIGGELTRDMLSLHAAYLFLQADPARGSAVDRSEIAVGGLMRLDRNWSLGADMRRDLIVDRFVSAGAVLSYVNECAGLDIYARRRFTSSDGSSDGTVVGLKVRLFGAGGDRDRASGACAYGAGPE